MTEVADSINEDSTCFTVGKTCNGRSTNRRESPYIRSLITGLNRVTIYFIDRLISFSFANKIVMRRSDQIKSSNVWPSAEAKRFYYSNIDYPLPSYMLRLFVRAPPSFIKGQEALFAVIRFSSHFDDPITWDGFDTS